MKKIFVHILMLLGLFAILYVNINAAITVKDVAPPAPSDSQKTFGREPDWPILTESSPRTSELIPIFMYHNFSADNNFNHQLDGLIVSRNHFDEQLCYLKENGCHAINFYELYQFLKEDKPIPQKSFIITFDDVYSEQYTIGYPLLVKYGFKATFFINTSNIGIGNLQGYSWPDMRAMESSGLIDIQSHGHRHIAMNLSNEGEAAYNVQHSFDLIDENLGPRNLRVFCYPSYSCSSRTRTLLKKVTDLQITRLGRYVNRNSSSDNIYRFRVSNEMTGQDLYRIICQNR